MALAVHVLGPHLMTERLLPLLAAAARWCSMSSGGMYSAGLRSTPDEIEYRDGAYDGVRAYARTKRMQVELADAWNDRLRGGDVRVESCHPGWASTPGRHRQPARLRQGDGPAAARRRVRRRHGRVARRDPPRLPPAPTTSGTTGRRGPRRTPCSGGTDRAARRAFLDYVAAATGTVWP